MITPRHICPACGEFLPHYCASLVLISRQKFTGKRVITITDRAPADVTEHAA
jgi:hypothetical protein